MGFPVNKLYHCGIVCVQQGYGLAWAGLFVQFSGEENEGLRVKRLLQSHPAIQWQSQALK